MPKRFHLSNKFSEGLVSCFRRSSYGLTVFRQQSHVAGVGAPHHILDLGDFDCGQRAFLLHVEQRDPVGIAQQQRARAGIEDFLAARHLDLLHDFILEVFNQKLRGRNKRTNTLIGRLSSRYKLFFFY